MAQGVKDLELSLQRLGLFLWHGFDLWELLHAVGVAKKKSQKTRTKFLENHLFIITEYLLDAYKILYELQIKLKAQ